MKSDLAPSAFSNLPDLDLSHFFQFFRFSIIPIRIHRCTLLGGGLDINFCPCSPSHFFRPSQTQRGSTRRIGLCSCIILLCNIVFVYHSELVDRNHSVYAINFIIKFNKVYEIRQCLMVKEFLAVAPARSVSL